MLRRTVDLDKVTSKDYRSSVKHAVGEASADAVHEGIIRMLRHRSKTAYEGLYVYDMRDGSLIGSVVNARKPKGVEFTQELREATSLAVDGGAQIAIVHNHPDSLPPSASDIRSLISNRAGAASSHVMTAVCTSSKSLETPCRGILSSMTELTESRSSGEMTRSGCFGHLTMSWGCMLSIFAEALEASRRMRKYDDDYNPLSDYLETCSDYDNDLWRKEALLVEEMTPEHGLKPDFYQICERAIMERFAAEEDMRAA